MILSRVIHHMKQQHWTAVFLDFLIVVVGVFIGLQVNNWNTVRQDRALEKQYLVRLRDDLQLSLKKANINIDRMNVQTSLEDQMVQNLMACHLDPSERGRFAAGVFLFGQFEPSPLVRSTIDELRSTGRLGLLHDVKLRQKLAETLQQDQIYDGVLQMIVSRATPGIVYLDQRTVIRPPKGGFDYNAIREGKVPAGSINFDFDALCKDPRSAPIVSDVQRVTGVVIGHYKDEEKLFKGLVQIIDKDLEKLN